MSIFLFGELREIYFFSRNIFGFVEYYIVEENI